MNWKGEDRNERDRSLHFDSGRARPQDRAVHDDVQGLPGCGDGGASSENAGGRAEDRLPAGQGKQDPVCPCGAQLQDPEALRCGVPAGQDLTFRRDAAPKIPCAILAKQPCLF
mgnify:CR=1 FL=1